MTKVCVIGNSHVACLKLAWDTLKIRHPDITLTFFAERASGVSALEPNDGILIPTTERLRKAIMHTSAGLSTIDLRNYDVVVIVGLNYGYPPAAGHFSCDAACQALLDATPTSLAFDLIGKIREISDIPIFVAHQPLWKHFGEVDNNSGPAPYRKMIEFLNDRVMREVEATILAQPAQTIANYFYTRREYSIGSTRLEITSESSHLEHPDRDRSHMNTRFGEIYLSTHLPTMAS